MDDWYDKGVIDYINKELKKGFSKEQIKEVLVKAGYSPENMGNCFTYLQKRKNKKIFISIFVVFILLSIIFSFVLYHDTSNISKKLDKLIMKGSVLCGQGNYDKAMKKFDEAVQLNSTSSKGYSYRGLCLLKSGRNGEAIIELKKAENLSRTYQHGYKNPSFRHILGKTYCEKGNYTEGIKQIRIAIKLNSSNLEFYRSLRNCSIELDNSKKRYNLTK